MAHERRMRQRPTGKVKKESTGNQVNVTTRRPGGAKPRGRKPSVN